MRVIIHEEEAVALVLDFKTPPRVLEAAERMDDLRKWNSDLRGKRNDPERIADVVPAGNIQDRFTQLLAAAKDRKDRREILQVDVSPAIVRIWREAKGNGARTRATNPHGVQIVGTIKDRSRCLIHQLREDSLDRSEVGIEIEMLFLDIQDQRVFRFEEAQRSIAFIAFRHEILTAWVPVCV